MTTLPPSTQPLELSDDGIRIFTLIILFFVINGCSFTFLTNFGFSTLQRNPTWRILLKNWLILPRKRRVRISFWKLKMTYLIVGLCDVLLLEME